MEAGRYFDDQRGTEYKSSQIEYKYITLSQLT